MTEQELIVDSFAGGGGASSGITAAVGRPPDVAINHDAAAIAMHRANHPETRHFTEDVFKASPRRVTGGRPVGLLWASPDCKDFSRAKGGQPVSKKIRGLAWSVIKWATEVAPRVIILENVREFEEWGPLVPRWDCAACHWKGTEGQTVLVRARRRCPRCDAPKLTQSKELVRDPARVGWTFKQFVGRLKARGYQVRWKVLNAADYGAPTHRRRLFLVARNDGLPVVWPDPTHGDPKKVGEPDLFGESLKPWRTAAECIDWNIPCPSIFTRKRPLAEATLKRIAHGIKRYVLDNPRPFLVVCNHGGEEFRESDLSSPMPTVTAARDAHGLVTPLLVPMTHQNKATGVDEPAPTVTTQTNRTVLVTPAIVRIGQTGSNGKCANAADVPLTTVTSKAEHLLVAPYLVQRYGEREGQTPRTSPVDTPMGVVTPHGNAGSLVAAFLAKHFGGVVGVPVNTPLPTTTARGTQTQVVAANLVHLNHGDKTSSAADEPMRTVTASGNHAALVYSFLTKYFKTAVGQSLDEPLHTATGTDRFGLITVSIDGEPFVIVDIGMRMLTPRELARCQGFPDSYLLTGTRTNQVERIGNSVSPNVAEAMVRANYVESEVSV